MMYLVVAYNDDTTLGIECENFYMEDGFIWTTGNGYKIKDLIPGANVKIVTQISEEDFEAHKIDADWEEEDGEPESGTMGLPFSR